MNNSPHRISSELTSEKIKIIKDIDLNSLFNLSYNFDLLKGLIEHLLTNQQKLQNQIDEMYQKDCERDKHTNDLLDDMKLIKETYVDKDTFNPVLNDVNNMKDKIRVHGNLFNEGKK
jgi:ferritin